jgi:hypothetical protein
MATQYSDNIVNPEPQVLGIAPCVYRKPYPSLLSDRIG